MVQLDCKNYGQHLLDRNHKPTASLGAPTHCLAQLPTVLLSLQQWSRPKHRSAR